MLSDVGTDMAMNLLARARPICVRRAVWYVAFFLSIELAVVAEALYVLGACGGRLQTKPA
jgi:hypothetical protein